MASPYRYLQFWLLPLLRRRIRVEGLDHLPSDGRFVVTPNHRSWIDSGLIGAALYKNIPKSLRFIARTSKYPFFGALAIPEYNQGAVLDLAYGFLTAGHPIVLFPEGNAHKDGTLRRGKTGAVRLALRANVPIVPIAIVGSRGLKLWKAMVWFLAWWIPCTVRIGQPFFLTPLQHKDNKEELREKTEQIISRIHQLMTTS